jgi:hypothetical protein
MHFDSIPMIDQIREPMPNMEALCGEAAQQRIQEIGAVSLIVRGATGSFHCLAEWSAAQRPTVIPTTLTQSQRLHARRCQWFGETKSIQDASGVGTDLDAGAYFPRLRRLLVHIYIQARSQQGQSRGESADPATDYADRNVAGCERRLLTLEMIRLYHQLTKHLPGRSEIPKPAESSRSML